MIPSPVHSGSCSIANGTAIPTGPGCSQRSPSSVMPCTAIAISPAERGVLVDREQRAAQPRLARDAAGHREPERHRQRDQRERHEPGRAARQPPAVVHRVAAGHDERVVSGAACGAGRGAGARRGRVARRRGGRSGRGRCRAPAGRGGGRRVRDHDAADDPPHHDLARRADRDRLGGPERGVAAVPHLAGQEGQRREEGPRGAGRDRPGRQLRRPPALSRHRRRAPGRGRRRIAAATGAAVVAAAVVVERLVVAVAAVVVEVVVVIAAAVVVRRRDGRRDGRGAPAPELPLPALALRPRLLLPRRSTRRARSGTRSPWRGGARSGGRSRCAPSGLDASSCVCTAAGSPPLPDASATAASTPRARTVTNEAILTREGMGCVLS